MITREVTHLSHTHALSTQSSVSLVSSLMMMLMLMLMLVREITRDYRTCSALASPELLTSRSRITETPRGQSRRYLHISNIYRHTSPLPSSTAARTRENDPSGNTRSDFVPPPRTRSQLFTLFIIATHLITNLFYNLQITKKITNDTKKVIQTQLITNC